MRHIITLLAALVAALTVAACGSAGGGAHPARTLSSAGTQDLAIAEHQLAPCIPGGMTTLTQARNWESLSHHQRLALGLRLAGQLSHTGAISAMWTCVAKTPGATPIADRKRALTACGEKVLAASGTRHGAVAADVTGFVRCVEVDK